MNKEFNNSKNKAWQQYEKGKEHKRRISLYETVRRNERFYRGEQWNSGEANSLPHPVFNIIQRIINFLVCSVASANISIHFTDENLPFASSEKDAKIMQDALSAITDNTAYRWKKNGMDRKMLQLLTDAAITGDGAIYCYWDSSLRSPQKFEGDIVTEIVDSVNIFPSDVNKADIQSQDYIIISGRAPVERLINEALRSGVSEEDANKIVADNEYLSSPGDMARYELEGDDEAKATYIIKFWKENGKVVFEKSTKNCVIRRARTDCSLYPIAYLNWTPVKSSFHGTSPISTLIPNQKFINRAYAMVMKHMTDTAFSKVIYDKSKIPEWSNEVGEAIAVYGGNISDAVSTVGVGEMQSGYMDLINSAVTLTKELMGATESALGNIEANNTSAILALQETSRIPLTQIRSAYYRCIEELANIWADMTCAYYPPERLLPCYSKNSTSVRKTDLSSLKNHILNAEIDVVEISRFSAAGVQSILDKLFDSGYLTPEQYIRRLPSGAFNNKEEFIDDLKTNYQESEEE